MYECSDVSGSAWTAECGVETYSVPELTSSQHNNKIGIWSLGVLTLELIEGLPKSSPLGSSWTSAIAKESRHQNRIPLLREILQLGPAPRPYVRNCLDRLYSDYRELDCLKSSTIEFIEPVSHDHCKIKIQKGHPESPKP